MITRRRRVARRKSSNPRSRPRAQDDAAAVRRELRTIPNIGPAMADDLIRLGVRGVSDLRGRDPVEMYERISRLDRAKHDPCVLDTFMAAVDFATTGRARPWWHYTPQRKRTYGAGAPSRGRR